MGLIYHIATRKLAGDAKLAGYYEPPTFHEEGFVHCSYARQVEFVANARFAGQPDLVLLEIEVDQLQDPVVDENLEGGDELFPHVYGAIPISAISEIYDFPSNAQGYFELPGSIGA